MSPSPIVQKFWNYCNPALAGHDDGMSYGDHPSAQLGTGPSARSGQALRHAQVRLRAVDA
jgi:hypothetical protein